MAKKIAYQSRIQQNKLSMFLITLVVIVLLLVVAVSGNNIKKKIEAKDNRIEELKVLIEAEKNREKSLEEFGKYIQTKGFYIEYAKEHLHLIYDDEILVKEKDN